jgi:hypothetical protein
MPCRDATRVTQSLTLSLKHNTVFGGGGTLNKLRAELRAKVILACDAHAKDGDSTPRVGEGDCTALSRACCAGVSATPTPQINEPLSEALCTTNEVMLNHCAVVQCIT